MVFGARVRVQFGVGGRDVSVCMAGMLPSVPASEQARRAQFLTSSVLACCCNQVIWARGSRVRASRMASAMSSVARRSRFMASSATPPVGHLSLARKDNLRILRHYGRIGWL